jgi:hypothetical protein
VGCKASPEDFVMQPREKDVKESVLAYQREMGLV